MMKWQNLLLILAKKRLYLCDTTCHGISQRCPLECTLMIPEVTAYVQCKRDSFSLAYHTKYGYILWLSFPSLPGYCTAWIDKIVKSFSRLLVADACEARSMKHNAQVCTEAALTKWFLPKSAFMFLEGVHIQKVIYLNLMLVMLVFHMVITSRTAPLRRMREHIWQAPSPMLLTLRQ